MNCNDVGAYILPYFQIQIFPKRYGGPCLKVSSQHLILYTNVLYALMVWAAFQIQIFPKRYGGLCL